MRQASPSLAVFEAANDTTTVEAGTSFPDSSEAELVANTCQDPQMAGPEAEDDIVEAQSSITERVCDSIQNESKLTSIAGIWAFGSPPNRRFAPPLPDLPEQPEPLSPEAVVTPVRGRTDPGVGAMGVGDGQDATMQVCGSSNRLASAAALTRTPNSLLSKRDRVKAELLNTEQTVTIHLLFYGSFSQTTPTHS